MLEPGRPIILVGSSTRFAAWSAARAGFAPHAVDLFGDRDLHPVAAVRVVAPSSWPGGILSALLEWPPWPVCYLGGLENQYDLLDQIAARQPIWGVRGDALRALRDPFELARAGLRMPAMTRSPSACPRDGSWLEKPLGSAGGLGIRVWNATAAHRAAEQPVYYQQRIAGIPLGASFLARAEGQCELLGVCRSWVCGAYAQQPFGYRASLGPLRLHTGTTVSLERLGAVLTRRFGLRGLFGVDLIRSRSGELWLLELNPRLTASMEVLERAWGFPLFSAQAQAYGLGAVDPLRFHDRSAVPPPRRVGKLVVYAPRPVRVPQADSLGPGDEADNRLADIPWPGTRIGAGEPVCSLLEYGPNLRLVRRKLHARHRAWLRRLHAPEWSAE